MNRTLSALQGAVGSSPLHRLDARVKVVVALVLVIGVVVTPDGRWIAYPLLWTLIGSLAGVAHVSAARLARLAGVALPFTLAAATLMFTTPGQPLIAGLPITDAGLARFAGIVLKSWLSVQVTLLLGLTTPFTELLWALDSLRVPATLTAIVGFMYRYLDTLQDEAERLLRARAARSGGGSGGSLLWRARIAGGMVGNLFLRSYERSERIHAAMLARGYAGQARRQSPPPLTRPVLLLGALPVFTVLILQIGVRL
ncbi:MAG: cobalt ECF transporter T component CbiQ [Anaerolineae bacterium]|nr:cobalt ECF transporter T component CbiQ [Anaerolineae bacterium]